MKMEFLSICCMKFCQRRCPDMIFSALRGICAALRTAIRIDPLDHQGKFDS
jgi:hypothetical protein